MIGLKQSYSSLLKSEGEVRVDILRFLHFWDGKNIA